MAKSYNCKVYLSDGSTKDNIFEIPDLSVQGALGRYFTNYNISYVQTNSTASIPISWGNAVGTLTPGKYLWIRIELITTSGTIAYLYSVAYIANDGTNGANGDDASWISKIELVQYLTSLAGALRIDGQDLILTYDDGTDYGNLRLTTDMTTGVSTLTWEDEVDYSFEVTNGELLVA